MQNKKKVLAKEIGARLRKLRQEAGYSREQMAARFGISVNGYGKNEAGLNMPGLKSLHYLSESRGISMDWLLFNKGTVRHNEKNPREKELELEVEELKRKQAKLDGVSALALNPEVAKMLEHMERSPVLYHQILLHFQEFKGEDKVHSA